jgi:hypothetical protein
MTFVSFMQKHPPKLLKDIHGRFLFDIQESPALDLLLMRYFFDRECIDAEFRDRVERTMKRFANVLRDILDEPELALR